MENKSKYNSQLCKLNDIANKLHFKNESCKSVKGTNSEKWEDYLTVKTFKPDYYLPPIESLKKFPSIIKHDERITNINISPKVINSKLINIDGTESEFCSIIIHFYNKMIKSKLTKNIKPLNDEKPWFNNLTEAYFTYATVTGTYYDDTNYYDPKIIDMKDISKCEVYLIGSPNHIHNVGGIVDHKSILKYLHERTIYYQLKKLSFFKNYTKIKAFKIWKMFIIQNKKNRNMYY
ncbi:hypothetical protein A3Q56_03887 [Intoshia linei]|uniref:Uncharacterized protein n=1 Tax=Intoshia linei TaxID=1819745 RepID=A0A177B3S7_9BILA|nr:hypothetical protein A3Q56_03887 [Intoshia linei]